MQQMNVNQLVLEYATERAGDLMEFDRKELGLGVVNPRTERVETVEEIRQNIARALERYPKDQLFINPDCGFWMLPRSVADGKIKALVEGRDLYEGRQHTPP